MSGLDGSKPQFSLHSTNFIYKNFMVQISYYNFFCGIIGIYETLYKEYFNLIFKKFEVHTSTMIKYLSLGATLT